MSNQINRGFVLASAIGSINGYKWTVTEGYKEHGTVAFLNLAGRSETETVYDTPAEAIKAIASSKTFDGKIYVGEYLTKAQAAKVKDVDIFRYVEPGQNPGKPKTMTHAQADAKNAIYAARDAAKAKTPAANLIVKPNQKGTAKAAKKSSRDF